MNYKNIHDEIIKRAQTRIIEADVYYEKHHIVPRCLGGDNSKENLVRLTAREHFIIHLLLIKLYPDNPKLVYAARMLSDVKSGASQISNRSQNRKYEWLRIKHSKVVSEQSKKLKGYK